MRFLFTLIGCATLAPIALAADAEAELRARDRHLAHALRKVSENPRQIGQDSLAWVLEREAVMRLLSIMSGTRPGPDKSSGWLVPSRTRYTWAWLSKRCDRDGDGAISADEFDGPSQAFRILDRDRDGSITSIDLDWSEKSTLAKANVNAKTLFRAIDADGDGQVDSEEWQAYMQKLAQGRNYLVQDDLLALFAAGGKAKGKGGAGRGGDVGGINLALFKAFFDGDVGSIFEGPRPGTPAPDFTLPLVDGKGVMTLSKQFDKRPIVLVFGSFT